MSGYDLSNEQELQRREEEGRVVHLTDPRGEPLYEGEGEAAIPVTITVAGRLSARYRKAEEAQNRLMSRRRPAGNADPVNARTTAIIGACIMGWQGLLHNGQPFPFTPGNVEVLLARAPRLHDLLWVEIHDDAAFFGANSTG